MCHQDKHDYRLLDCLHSFCISCIEQLVLSADKQGEIRCPLCRAVTCLPSSGVQGLATDVTRRTAEKTACAWKDESRCSNEAECWCGLCNAGYCSAHGLKHITANRGHSIVSMPDGGESGDRQSTGIVDKIQTCTEHKDQHLTLFCVPCDVAVCGHCIGIGKHKEHQPIVLAKDKVKEKKKEILGKVEEVEKEFLPRALSYLKAVDEVGEKLCARAKDVRSEIELAGKKAVEAIETRVLQKLQEVEDIECARHKVLDGEHDRVKTLCEDAKRAVEFGSRLVKERTGSGEAGLPAWLALGSRVSSLVSSELGDTPPSHNNLDFEAVTDEAQLHQSDNMLGGVVTYDASAAHSLLEGDKERRCDRNESVSFVVQTCDSRGKLLRRGGDRITARYSKCPGAGRADFQSRISDNGDGSYHVTFTPRVVGDYVVEVFVNGAKLPNTLSIVCGNLRMTFDPHHCQPGITLSNAQQTASRSGSGGWGAVTGKPAMHTGKHQWTVVCESDNYSGTDGRMMGVITPDAMAQGGFYYMAYCWYSNSGQSYSKGTARGQIDRWGNGTTLRFDLDCNSHTLQITNTTSGKSAFIDNLPDEKLLPFFSMYHAGQKTTFI